MPFSAPAFFFHMSKMFPFKDFFHLGKKKVARDEIGWIGSVEHRGHAIFGQKLLNSQWDMGKCAHKSPIMQ